MGSRLVSFLSSSRATRGAGSSSHDRVLMARISVRLFLGGALLVLVVLALPHGRLETVGMLTVCGGCLLGAALMHVAAGRLPYGAFDAIAAYATVLITGARLFANTAGDNGTGIQALYVSVVLFVFYFPPARTLSCTGRGSGRCTGRRSTLRARRTAPP